MTHAPTAEQAAILAAATESTTSLMISAYAGCGKTSTMVMIAQALPPGPALALAFNVKIKKELEKRFPSHFEIKTLNGLGHSAWNKAIGKRCEVDDRKLGKIVTSISKEAGYDRLSEELWTNIRTLVTKAQQAGLVPSKYPHASLVPDTDETWAELADDAYIDTTEELRTLARAVLIESIRQAFEGVISFDDQIYMSAMFNGVFPRFPLVMVDEAQDLSPLNHIMVRRCAAGRLIVVGDPKQAIYAFRGADSVSMSKLRAMRKEWIDLPLTLTFRCPRKVVARQQAHAPGFRAAEANHDGNIKVVLHDEPWTWGLVESLLPAPHAEVAVLCRNNAPLLDMAFRLIRGGVGVKMLGRDIGKSLAALAKKLLPDASMPAEVAVGVVRDWMESEIRVARANGKDAKISAVTDRGECIMAVLESGCATAGEVRAKIEDLFSREYGTVTLSTGHRAKGLEWPLVVHLDAFRLPSGYAKAQAAQGNTAPLQQDKNLAYVIDTRTQHTLVIARLEDFVME